MQNLNSLFRELMDRELERNEMLKDIGYEGFALSDEEVFKHGVDVFIKQVQQKAMEALNGRTS
tara:strand:- start:207 stop:395 length:189 start_codon:yes stop_codon:yes gene_type:complete